MNLHIGALGAAVFAAYLLIIMTALRLVAARHANSTLGKALLFMVG